MFAGMSLYAMTTTRDLHRFGTYLVMGLWGLIICQRTEYALQVQRP